MSVKLEYANNENLSFLQRHPTLREFLTSPALFITIGSFIAAVIICYTQYGYIPDGTREWPIAQIKVPLWHLLWMGLWTGYCMAIVGQAGGIFCLPYFMTILQFNTVNVSPTSTINTAVGPWGAFFGYLKGKQFNLDMAVFPILGACVGALIGPFIRVYYLSDPTAFKAIIGVLLVYMGCNLWYQITPMYLKGQQSLVTKFNEIARQRKERGEAPDGLPSDFRVETVKRDWNVVHVKYWGEELKLSSKLLVAIGFVIGVISSTLGVGGGFLLVPLMAMLGVPMYVLVTCTIPFVLALSIVSLFSYTVILPQLTGSLVGPEWGLGLFVVSGSCLGAWLASKAQRFTPDKVLKPMLGSIIGIFGLLYVLNYFFTLPFKV
ncbi:sulfite exporter TauE/SafE family protein [Desulfallas thermosapovorans]|uniref:Probable membrane transporter protein n=1 Tax=Desulfallas thermosapovorans DSM 6562 TaxID=1121431 RepID=A0A5S4ZM93_9FIRM|nr:sulfite exporter TauE/SafE family protein [Desulfallas thermosapovorans]TYO90418.1 putative membrane protein YfcA [Desulfallas thermosapovorans DSM 6562]